METRDGMSVTARVRSSSVRASPRPKWSNGSTETDWINLICGDPPEFASVLMTR